MYKRNVLATKCPFIFARLVFNKSWSELSGGGGTLPKACGDLSNSDIVCVPSFYGSYSLFVSDDVISPDP